MPPLSPLLADAAPRFQAPSLPTPLVYDTSSAAQRQRVVNYCAKRLVDMVFVTGLDLATARSRFRRKPADTPGGLDEDAVDLLHAAEVEQAWTQGAITIEADEADRRITVTWPGAETFTGTAIARPNYGGILLGAHQTPGFDPAPLARPARPTAPWPIGDATPRPNHPPPCNKPPPRFSPAPPASTAFSPPPRTASSSNNTGRREPPTAPRQAGP